MTGRPRKYDHNAVLDLWARNLSTNAIAASLGLEKDATVTAIVLKARREGDPRAVIREPSTILRKPLAVATSIRLYTLGGGVSFIAQTVFVTQIGPGSHKCRRVPISLAALPTPMELSHG